MTSYIVLTAIGTDRPGLVDDISAYLTEKEINIEDSRMAVLGGEFAVILLASGDEGSIESLKDNTESIEKKTGLAIGIKPTIAPGQRNIEPSIPHKLHVTSLDHPGLVHEITKVLHEYNINIESLDTHVSHAPITGTPIFNMHCIINIPIDKKITLIKETLYSLEQKLNIDVDFEALETF